MSLLHELERIKVKDKPNFLLIYIDCLRKDRLNLMPQILRLTRKDGWTTFGDHRTVAHCSDPNFLTILTGVMPDEHQVRTQMGKLYTKAFPTLTLMLKKYGWKTWSYQPVAVPRFYLYGFDDAMIHYTNSVSDIKLQGLRKLISGCGTDPWFGFLRLMDTHYPYNGEDLPEYKTDIPRQYDRAVMHTDVFVNELITYVQRKYPNTIIVLGSDHGEMLGERGLWDHLFSLTESLVRVPLFVYVPDGKQKFTDVWTQHTIIAPLVRTAAGLKDKSPEWEWLNGNGDLPNPDLMEMVAWGTSNRNDWKHRSLFMHYEEKEFKYTVNWHLGEEIGFELHIDGNEEMNFFGDNHVSHMLAETMVERYPTTPYPKWGDVQGFVFEPDNFPMGQDGLGIDG